MVMKHYPPDLRAGAVALYQLRPGTTIESVAADLGVNPETLRSWIRAAGKRRRLDKAESAVVSQSRLVAENAALRARRSVS
ncbi:transposase [Streptomyces sp. NPDC001635]